MLNHQEDRNQRNLQDYCFSGKGKKIPKRSSSFQCNERDFKYCFCHDVQRRLRLCNMAKKAMKLHHIICLCSTFLQASLPYFTFSLCIIALFVKLLDITVTLLPCKYNICMWIFLGVKVHVRFHYSSLPGELFSRNRQNISKMHLLAPDKIKRVSQEWNLGQPQSGWDTSI